ncbi:MAG TPA: MDR family MFS transporter [Chloroflexota bacterium]
MTATTDSLDHLPAPTLGNEIRGVRLLVLTIAVAAGMLLAALDSNITATAMPTIVSALGGLGLYSWVFAGYALASTTAMPLFGRLSDLYGRKQLYLGGMLLFVLASAACAGANSMLVLILGRTVQGIGGAAIMALTFTLIADLYPPDKRGQVQGVTSSAWAISAIVGPALGALLVTTLGWRWVFLVNLPVSVLPIALIGWLLHEQPRQSSSRSVDVGGSVTLSASVLCLMFAALQAGNQHQLVSPTIVVLVVASVLLLAGFVFLETRVPTPTVPLELFRIRMFFLGALASLVFGWVAFCVGVFVPLFAQGVLGGSALSAGAVLLPNTMGWSVAAAVAGPLVRPLGYRRMSLLGFGVLVLSEILLVRLNVTSSLTEVAISMALAGVASGILSPTLLLAIQNTVDPNQLGVATSLAMFLRNIGYSVGVSVMGAMLAGGLASRLGGLAVNADALVAAGATAGLDPAQAAQFHQALAAALHDVFLFSLVVSVLGIATAVGMTGWQTQRAPSGERDGLLP